ncbi:MAG: aldo/keto reductase [SAR324 cluster bacterium]
MDSQPHPFNRRQALALLGGAALALAAGSGRGASAPGQLMRTIPATGEALPAVGLGTSVTFDREPSARAPLREVVRRFVASGGRLIDTAPSYGEAEPAVGEIVTSLGLRDRLFLATKVLAATRRDGLEQLNTSVQRLGGPIDLIQVHNMRDWRNQLALLREWKAAGRVRYVGVTASWEEALDEMAGIVAAAPLDFVQINYSLGERKAEARLLPLAAEKRVAVLVNRPFMRTELFRALRGKPLPPWASDFDCASWAQFLLKFVLSHPAVTCALPATANPEHLSDNMRAGLGRLPDAAQRRRMAAFFDEQAG